MNVEKRLNDGSDILSMSLEEFLACIDYAVTETTNDYAYSELNVDESKLDSDLPLSGYTKLVDEGVFTINDDGYPMLSEDRQKASVVAFIDAFRNQGTITTIKVALNRKRMTLIYLSSSDYWTIYWKAKSEYRIIAGSMMQTNPGMSLYQSLIRVIERLGTDKVSFMFMVKTRTGTPIASTFITSDDNNDRFIEERPDSTMLIGDNDHWPARYQKYSIYDRFNEILRGV